MIWFAVVRIPAFAIARARRTDPALAAQPLVLVTSDRRRTTVYAACPSAQYAGISAGQDLLHARLLCPDAHVRSAQPDDDAAGFIALTRCLAAFSPRVAAGPMLPDATVVLDLARPTIPQLMARGVAIRQAVEAQLGLAPALGIAPSRFVAEQAAWIGGAGTIALVPEASLPRLLDGVPITRLPIADATQTRLSAFGIRTIGALARLPRDALQVQFGAEARDLWCLARGEDITPFLPQQSTTPLGVQQRFDGPVNNRYALLAALKLLAARLSAHLNQRGWSARVLRLALTLDDGNTHTFDHALPAPATQVEHLTRVLTMLLTTAAPPCGVVRIAVLVTAHAPLATTQLDLFTSTQPQREAAQTTLQQLATRYPGRLLRAEYAHPDAALPEERVVLHAREPP
jgi:nucleotidyltransferase/DNA polymerase involved in DNA repair